MSLTSREAGRRPRIPDVTIKRLPVYLRALDEAGERGVEIVSSAELARQTGFTSEQIRKDLAYFGAFGTRGVGYDVGTLADRIRRILGLHRVVPAALVGAGHLGTALARYNLTRPHPVRIEAIFDVAPDKVGTSIEGVTVEPVERLEETVRAKGCRLAILAVPAPAAQEAAQRLVAAGVEAILNFAPAQLQVPAHVQVQHIDLGLELESLAYYTAGERLSV
ncbi:MAG: redox-sensing transcriptional repressor Rex [Clostridia bacterium]|nr:redox-sensing transcriptional repressor Rex [Clostridia bacterium]